MPLIGPPTIELLRVVGRAISTPTIFPSPTADAKVVLGSPEAWYEVGEGGATESTDGAEDRPGDREKGLDEGEMTERRKRFAFSLEPASFFKKCSSFEMCSFPLKSDPEGNDLTQIRWGRDRRARYKRGGALISDD